jgi:hypothetical protein
VSFFSFLNHWWNLPYLVMLGCTGVWMALQLVGFAGHDGDVDHDVEVDVDADHDVDAQPDTEGDQAGGALAWLGAGHVPFMVVWNTFFIFGGFAGLVVNRVLSANGGYPLWGWFAAGAAAFVAGAAGAKLFGRLVGRFVDVGGRGSAKKRELPGQIGIVASELVDAEFGEVRVRDERGNEQLVHARVAPGEPPPKRGDDVVVVEYDAETELYLVAPYAAIKRDAKA